MLFLYAPNTLFNKIALPLRTFLLIGYFPNVKNPKTFNEKIMHRRAFKKDPRASLIADKWLVRQYVKEKGFENILNEVYYVTDKPDTIDFDKLPERFVIKANYASGMNIIVKDKSKLQKEKVVSKCKHWIDEQDSILERASEIHYRDIKPKIIIEEYLEEHDEYGLKDYKFWCFQGEVRYVNVHVIKNKSRLTVMYDRNWILQPFSTGNKPMPTVTILKPPCLDRMISIAEQLSKGFSFLRVDLYCINESEIIFGELTYNSGGGTVIFLPRKYDDYFGRYLVCV